MSDAVYRSAVEAWEAFKSIGGLDLSGRDADLEVDILAHLGQPEAGRLEIALHAVGTDDLVRAIFASAKPFVSMFSAIIAFFTSAGANEGRRQWAIKIDDTYMGLEDFERFVAATLNISVALDVPDIRDTSRLSEILRSVPGASDKSLFDDATIDPELVDWVQAYKKGAFPDFPAVLNRFRVSPGFEDLRRIVAARLAMAHRTYGDREGLKRHHPTLKWSMTKPYDPYFPFTVGQDETDYWSGSMIVSLLHALKAPSYARDAVEQALRKELAGPRRALDVTVSVGDLERILSLPVWQRRHELYAVWIATEIVRAVPDHEVELHHEDGRIVFAFKETAVATFVTSRPERRLIAERRSPLADPIGTGRKENVQPDYGVWSNSAKGEQCHLVVEVKHYKRTKNRAFREVLLDYARAHPTAAVALVNYGPVGKLYEGSDPALWKQCTAIENLTPDNDEARDSLAKLVQAAIGEPFRRHRKKDGSPPALLIDISGSMHSLLTTDVRSAVEKHAGTAKTTTLVLADIEVVEQLTLADISTFDLGRLPNRGTALVAPVDALLENYAHILVVTDQDGETQLRESFSVDPLAEWGDVRFLDVSITT
jgi:hypothetical protein